MKLQLRAVKTGLIFGLLLFTATVLRAQKPVASVIFAPVKNLPADQRVEKAFNLYKDNFRGSTEQAAMRALDTLQNMAVAWNDLTLEGNVAILRADYYSVNRGFNQLSIVYHNQAIEFAVTHNLPVDEAIYLHKKGLYFFTFSHNEEACQCFLEAYEKFRKIGFDKVPYMGTYFYEEAKFYYVLKDYNNALQMLTAALRYPLASVRTRVSLINTIGLIYRNQKHYEPALNYFSRSLAEARSAKDTVWMGITGGNIGSVYFMQGKYDAARPLIRTDYNASLHYGDSVNAGTALLRLSRINLLTNHYTNALAQLDTAERLINNRRYSVNLASLVEYCNQRSLLYEKTGQLAQAISYRQKYEAAKDSLTRRDNISAIENVKLRWTTERHHNQITDLENKAATSRFKRNAVIVILLLSIAIFVLLYNRQRLKAHKDQELLLAEKRRVDEELKNAAALLKQYTENLRQNNTIIEKFKGEIAQFKAQNNDRKGTDNLEKLLQARLMTDESWDEFKRLFNRVHSGFFTRLRKSYPNLTDTDTRLLALIKLGLSNREMANMLGVTIEGVKKSKQRMRKKMELPPEAEIEQVITTL